MSKKLMPIYIMLFLCIILIDCTNSKIYQASPVNAQTQTSNAAKDSSSSMPVSSANNPDNELLYGKYPEPILKLIGENPDVKKDYKDLTRGDLKKIRTLANYSYPDESYYGFEPNKEYDFSILLDMPNMTALEINFGNNIRLKDYSVLKQLKNLNNLSISNISDSDIENITGLASLIWLSIQDSKITNIEFIKNLKNLTMFSLDNVPGVHDFKPLEYLIKLDILDLCNSNLTEKDLITVPDMDLVKVMGLGGNSIKSLNQYPRMKNLENLVLENNPLTGINLSPNRLPNIKYLSLINTEISNLNNLKGVEDIEMIYLNGTGVRKLSPLKKYKNLRTIIADVNNIEDKDQFEGTSISIGEID